MKLQVFAILIFGFLSVQSHAAKMREIKQLLPAEAWIAKQTAISIEKLAENIHPAGTVPGVVVASPQRANPDYFRHWIRDAALVMDVVFDLHERAQSPKERQRWDSLLKSYATFSRENQMSYALTGLGEPIFEVNGQAFSGPWGRPQNDGPALRAITLTRWAQSLLDRGEKAYVLTHLYSSALPASTVIKADLEYVSHHWGASSFDLWEEVRGQHFFTMMVQRRALVLGADLADRLKDPQAAKWYRQQAKALEARIDSHWDASKQQILATLDRVEGADYKHSNLDVAVLLGVLHGSTGNYFKANDGRVLLTVEKLVKAFKNLYPINHRSGVPGVAIGRYPEDIYAGTNFDGGNPWVLSTLALAQHCYLMAQEHAGGNQKQARRWLEAGDEFVQRVQYHANPDGSLSEQINRHNGYMVSARDLTWSYASFLTAVWAREKSVQMLKQK